MHRISLLSKLTRIFVPFLLSHKTKTVYAHICNQQQLCLFQHAAVHSKMTTQPHPLEPPGSFYRQSGEGEEGGG